MPMRTDDLFHWAAIIVSPTIYLADLSLSYALVPWVCATGHAGTLHAVSAIGLLLIVAPLLIGWRLVHRRTAMNYASNLGAAIARHLQIVVDPTEIAELAAGLAAPEETRQHDAVRWWNGLSKEDRTMATGASTSWTFLICADRVADQRDGFRESPNSASHECCGRAHGRGQSAPGLVVPADYASPQ